MKVAKVLETRDRIVEVMKAMTAIDVAYLRAHPDTPTLSSVRETIATPVVDEMRDVGAILSSRQACPPDLVAWRCAEMIVAGHEPTISVKEEPHLSGMYGLVFGVVLEDLVEWY